MTQEDIFKMAQEAGFDVHRGEWLFQMLERFAALVAAAERNKVAQWMIDRSYATGHGDTVEDLLKELDWQVREEERELCAQVCEQIADAPSNMVLGVALDCAVAIRARGEVSVASDDLPSIARSAYIVADAMLKERQK